jgi:hypothetical protein
MAKTVEVAAAVLIVDQRLVLIVLWLAEAV